MTNTNKVLAVAGKTAAGIAGCLAFAVAMEWGVQAWEEDSHETAERYFRYREDGLSSAYDEAIHHDPVAVSEIRKAMQELSACEKKHNALYVDVIERIESKRKGTFHFFPYVWSNLTQNVRN
ncbi:MAG: hypothetical protein PHX68_03740 [Alphaproteobacteria bacterium]|nr:hypothetical protein [Alphaproteobacteria bacterium]